MMMSAHDTSCRGHDWLDLLCRFIYYFDVLRIMSIRSFLSKIDDIVEVEEEVSLEMGVTRKLMESPSTPVLFKNLSGFRAVGNLWSERRRIASAMNIDQREMIGAFLRALSSPCGFREVDYAGFERNVDQNFDLRKLPIPKFFPGDGGRYVTAAVAVAEFEGKRNLSYHRLMLLDEKRFAIRLVPRHLYTMYKKSIETGEELKVAFCIGNCPCISLAASCSVDYDQDEMEIASALRLIGTGEPVEVRRLKSGILVPAHSEFVLEGRITEEQVEEGPFVDITGTYDRVRYQPVVEIDRIYYQDDPIFHIILPGGLEHYLLMGMPREPVIFKTVRQVVPRVHAVRLTEGGCCWLHGVVSITKNREGDAKNAIMAAFTGHPSMKRVIVVDEDIDIFDDREVEWAVATRFQADKDLVMINNTAGSSLDPSSESLTSKVGIDATKPLDSKKFDRAVLE